MPTNFVGAPFIVSIFSGIEIVWIRGGEYQDFPPKIFCVTVQKNSVGEPFSVSLCSGTEKVRIRGVGSIKIFRRKFPVSQCRRYP